MRPPPSRWAPSGAGLDGAAADGYEAMTILAGGRVLSTAGFPRAD